LFDCEAFRAGKQLVNFSAVLERFIEGNESHCEALTVSEFAVRLVDPTAFARVFECHVNYEHRNLVVCSVISSVLASPADRLRGFDLCDAVDVNFPGLRGVRWVLKHLNDFALRDVFACDVRRLIERAAAGNKLIVHLRVPSCSVVFQSMSLFYSMFGRL